MIMKGFFVLKKILFAIVLAGMINIQVPQQAQATGFKKTLYTIGLLCFFCLSTADLEFGNLEVGLLRYRIENRAREFARQRANPVNSYTLHYWSQAYIAYVLSELKKSEKTANEILATGREIDTANIWRTFDIDEVIWPYFNQAADNPEALKLFIDQAWQEIKQAFEV